MSSHNKRKEPWRNPNERHYCALCNVWLGSDRASVLLHENGKKHKEKVEESIEQRRQEQAQQDSHAKLLQQSLKQMEAAAQQSTPQDQRFYGLAAAAPQPMPCAVSSSYPPPPAHLRRPPPVPPVSGPPPPPKGKRSEPSPDASKSEWQARKKHRQEDKQRSRNDQVGQEETVESVPEPSQRRRTIAPDEGHYSHGEISQSQQTYLEGPTFGDILEEGMPLQLWTGVASASLAEKRLLDRDMYWKDGLVVAVRKRRRPEPNTSRLVVDVAYLQTPADTEETVEKSVPLDRIRIRLGADATIPDTLEEARLLAMGGEEEVVATDHVPQELDESTGLSSWSTVKVTRTTVRQELKDERERLRQERREAAKKAEKLEKEAQARKMEEAKVANADDSALGAYDVWSRKDGYKGVDIHSQAKVEVHDLGKKLSDGKASVGFKKTAFKAKKKKQNRRTTSADDD